MAESVPERLRAAMNEARKRRDQGRTVLLSTILADLKNRELELHAEAAALETFLPPAVDAAEIRAAVRAAIGGGAKDLGALMKQVMPQFKGRADGKMVNQIAREELATTV